MNRVVKFRGKSLITNEELDRMKIIHENGWVYGNLISNGKFPMIVGDIADWGDDYIAHEWFVAVEPESVGEFTNLQDRNGVEVYEGDILKCKCSKNVLAGYSLEEETFYKHSVIEWWQSHSNLGYRLRDGKGKTFMAKPSSLRTMEVEVIGNIHDHPHFLGVTK